MEYSTLIKSEAEKAEGLLDPLSKPISPEKQNYSLKIDKYQSTAPNNYSRFEEPGNTLKKKPTPTLNHQSNLGAIGDPEIELSLID